MYKLAEIHHFFSGLRGHHMQIIVPSSQVRMRKSSIGPLRVRNEGEAPGKSRPRVSTSGSRNSRLSGSSRSSFGSGRPSLASQTSKSGKPHGRPSTIPTTSRRTSTRSYGHHEILKDPRPISERYYKDKCIRELIEFLAEKGYSYPCSIKILHSPSSKEFIRIFEFMYSLMEPGFKCSAKIEEQFPAIMKALGYPFSISKSAMYAIGSPHTWPTLLAALSWLKGAIEYCMSLDVDSVLFPGSPTDDFQSVPTTKTVFKYCEMTYNEFLQGADTFEELDDQLAKQIRKSSPGGDLEGLIHENKRLSQELEALEMDSDPLIELKDRLAALRVDKDKLNKYHENLDNHKNQLAKTLQNMQLEGQTLEAEQEVLKQGNAKMQGILQTQVFSKADVQRINMERQTLQQQIEMHTLDTEAIQKEIWEDERQIAKGQEQIQKKCAEYNHMAKELSLIPQTAENDVDYELKPLLEEVHSNHFFNTIKPALNQLKNQCMDTNNQLMESAIIGQNNLGQLVDRVVEKQAELASLEKKVQNLNQELDVTKSTQQAEIQRLQNENDLLEYEVKDMYLNRTTSLPALEAEVMEEKQKSQMLRVNHRRDEMRCCDFITTVANLIVEHKETIQEHAAKVESEVKKELDKERAKLDSMSK